MDFGFHGRLSFTDAQSIYETVKRGNTLKSWHDLFNNRLHFKLNCRRFLGLVSYTDSVCSKKSKTTATFHQIGCPCRYGKESHGVLVDMLFVVLSHFPNIFWVDIEWHISKGYVCFIDILVQMHDFEKKMSLLFLGFWKDDWTYYLVSVMKSAKITPTSFACIQCFLSVCT